MFFLTTVITSEYLVLPKHTRCMIYDLHHSNTFLYLHFSQELARYTISFLFIFSQTGNILNYSSNYSPREKAGWPMPYRRVGEVHRYSLRAY